MKLLDQSAQTNWKFIAIVVVLGLVAAGVMLIFQNSLYQPQPIQLAQPQIQKPTPKETQPQEKAQTEVDTSSWQTYRNEELGFEVRYPKDKFVMVPVERVRIASSSPLVSSTYHDGLKLIRPDAKDQLGKEGCAYSQMGAPGVVCNAAMEDGISLLIIEKGTSFEEYAKVERITIADRKGIKYSYAGAGSGTSHYFIPLREKSTLVITKHWTFDAEGLEGRVHDSVPEFDQILSTFRFVE